MGLPAENSGISPQRQNGFGPFFFAHTNVLIHAGKDVNLFLIRFSKNFERVSLWGKIGFSLDLVPPNDYFKSLVRISWEEYALNIAETVSSRSEDRYVKVGSCALNAQHMVVAVGYNGLASGKDVKYDFWRNRDHRRKYMIHAEVNCLSLFKKGEAQMLAVTLLPCSSCATMIAGYGISKVVYRDIYKRDTSALEIFDFYAIECIKHGN